MPRYIYDLSGRLVGTQEANGNLTTQALLPVVGNDGEGQVAYDRKISALT
ncbi:hypothetical protein [Ferribacterium limneticum]|nr:hypothetical protein [Ferribacterium limneticum]